jgi:hypothetical protein
MCWDPVARHVEELKAHSQGSPLEATGPESRRRNFEIQVIILPEVLPRPSCSSLSTCICALKAKGEQIISKRTIPEANRI